MSALALQSSSRSEPGLLWASVLALLVHVLFAVLMFFGLDWKTVPPEGMVVDIWHDLPQLEKQESVRPKTIPQPVKVKQESVRPKSVPQPNEAKQEDSVKLNIKAPQPPRKPEIVRKEKKPLPEPVKVHKPAQVDQKKKAQERLKERQRKQEKAEAQQQQREQEALARQQAAARSRLMNEIAQYKAKILAKIKSRIVMPPDLPGNPAVEFNVTLLPGGDILDARLLKSSGYIAFDSAVERAIFLSKPLPLPSDPTLFSEFRNLNIKAHYQE